LFSVILKNRKKNEHTEIKSPTFNSHNCRQFIKDNYIGNDYTEKRHKKIKIKSNRWTN
jgi:hypothetical protein